MSLDSELSDDEIFYGKLSLKEVKKKLFLNNNRQTISSAKPLIKENKEVNNSFKLIEVHSEPEFTSQRQNEFKLESEECGRVNSNPDFLRRDSYSNWDVKSSEDSFLKLEKMVMNMCMTPDKEELDNTLDIVDHILSSAKCQGMANNNEINNGSIQTTKEDINSDSKMNTPNMDGEFGPEHGTNNSLLGSIHNKTCEEMQKRDHIIPKIEEPEQLATPNKPIFKTPSLVKSKKKLEAQHSSGHKYCTPNRIKYSTPLKQNILSSTKKTPHRTNAYQHIASPVASYIKQCPQVPLFKDVVPKKPLPVKSNIPKPVKNELDVKSGNKENVMLPPVAYRSAKKTKLINIPDKEKMPQCTWAKKIATSLPKPLVIKHDHREMNVIAKPLPSSHDSFADLSLHQAEISVCTQQSAFKKL